MLCPRSDQARSRIASSVTVTRKIAVSVFVITHMSKPSDRFSQAGKLYKTTIAPRS
jgi:hypothetical protein